MLLVYRFSGCTRCPRSESQQPCDRPQWSEGSRGLLHPEEGPGVPLPLEVGVDDLVIVAEQLAFAVPDVRYRPERRAGILFRGLLLISRLGVPQTDASTSVGWHPGRRHNVSDTVVVPERQHTSLRWLVLEYR